MKKSFLDLRLLTRRENSLLKQPDRFKFKSKRTMSSTPLLTTFMALKMLFKQWLMHGIWPKLLLLLKLELTDNQLQMMDKLYHYQKKNYQDNQTAKMMMKTHFMSAKLSGDTIKLS